jgi:hypothetical protein
MGVVVRGLVVALGLVLMLLGLGWIVTTQGTWGVGLWWVAIGGFLVLAVAFERQRYRSEAAERTNAPAGPGGGEKRDELLEARFRPTAEVFIDPPTGHRMRVLAEPDTGERRYVAEA